MWYEIISGIALLSTILSGKTGFGGRKGDEKMKIKNWKEYVVPGIALEELEAELKKDGWLDGEGQLILVEENGEDYRKQFWQEYDVAFQDEILAE